MKRLIYYIRQNRIDILSTLIAVGTIIIGYILVIESQELYALLAITIGSFFLISFIKSSEKDFYFLSLMNRRHIDDWIGSGDFKYNRIDKCFEITNAHPGFLYIKTFNWSNYRLNFDFRINQSCIGVIVRAQNLSNYVMLQIDENGINPHLRVSTGWKRYEASNTNLNFSSQLSLDRWYNCNIICEGKTISVKILSQDSEKIIDRKWEIPTEHLIFTFRDEVRNQEISFPAFPNWELGAVGFRNYGDEKAQLKNFLIEKT